MFSFLSLLLIVVIDLPSLPLPGNAAIRVRDGVGLCQYRCCRRWDCFVSMGVCCCWNQLPESFLVVIGCWNCTIMLVDVGIGGIVVVVGGFEEKRMKSEITVWITGSTHYRIDALLGDMVNCLLLIVPFRRVRKVVFVLYELVFILLCKGPRGVCCWGNAVVRSKKKLDKNIRPTGCWRLEKNRRKIERRLGHVPVPGVAKTVPAR